MLYFLSINVGWYSEGLKLPVKWYNRWLYIEHIPNGAEIFKLIESDKAKSLLEPTWYLKSFRLKPVGINRQNYVNVDFSLEDDGYKANICMLEVEERFEKNVRRCNPERIIP